MENQKVKNLRKHKAIATGLFVLMAVIYFALVLIMKNNIHPWMPYVKAFAEAGMVGALADWFAVTALFRYPLGLKIPHTNLIENSKNAIGDNLGSFVTENFLTSATIRPYIEKLDVAHFVGQWMAKEKNKQIVFEEFKNFAKKVITELDDKSISNTLSKKATKLMADLHIEDWASKGILYLIENDEHNKLLSILLPKAKTYVEENRDAIYTKVVEKYRLLEYVGGQTITNQLVSGIKHFLSEIENNEDHELRRDLTENLKSLAEQLVTDLSYRSKFDEVKNAFITEEKLAEYSVKIWDNIKGEVLENLENKYSGLNHYLQNTIDEIAESLEKDESVQQKINGFIRQFIYKLALRNSKEIGTIISKTVENWDGKELSDKLELEVGKDLQFIRVNGTLVGGLVGLAIYIVTQWIH